MMKFKNFVYDLGILLKEKAVEAKQEKDNFPNSDYKIGYLMAMHEVIDLMKQQASVFEINRKDTGLDDIDSEIDLL